MESKLKLIVPENFKEFGEKVNKHINIIRNNEYDNNYIVGLKLPRYGDSEGKSVLLESVRNQDIYILTDIKNYSVGYEFHGNFHNMSCDEHFQDIKRIISSINNRANKITVVMPFLYQSRQDKRGEGESLDCADGLQDLQNHKVRELITFDAHNPTVANAIPNKMGFCNAYVTGDMVINMIKNENIDLNNIFVVAPDNGARPKAIFLADILGGVRYGNFDKRRDYSRVDGGTNPIKYHEFVGPDRLDGLDIIVIDDMISTGNSLIDTAKKLKDRGANRIFLMTTFALFTSGIDDFNLAYEKGYFNKVYSTNLCYVPDEIKQLPWYEDVDCSYKVAQIINNLHEGKSISKLLNGKEEAVEKIKLLKK